LCNSCEDSYTSESDMKTKIILDPSANLQDYEFRDLNFIHTQVMNIGVFDIDRSDESIENKKYQLINAIGMEDKRGIQLLDMSDEFWSYYNLRQLIYLSKMIGFYPKVDSDLSPLSPILLPNNFYELGMLSNYYYYSWDCLRNSLAIAGLGKSDQYGYPQMDSFHYGKNITKSRFPNICSALNSYIPSIIINFAIYGYQPVVDKVFRYEEIADKLKVGDIVYMVPLDWGFDDYNEYLAFASVELSILFLESFANEMNLLGSEDLKDIEESELHATIDQQFARYFYELTTLSPNQQQLVLEHCKTVISNILLNNSSIIDLNNGIRDLRLRFDQTESEMTLSNTVHAYEFEEGKFYNPRRANFHLFTILDRTESGLLSLQIDGANPLKPLTIEDPSITTRTVDRCVILRKK
jgi:hypothetical protein